MNAGFVAALRVAAQPPTVARKSSKTALTSADRSIWPARRSARSTPDRSTPSRCRSARWHQGRSPHRPRRPRAARQRPAYPWTVCSRQCDGWGDRTRVWRRGGKIGPRNGFRVSSQLRRRDWEVGRLGVRCQRSASAFARLIVPVWIAATTPPSTSTAEVGPSVKLVARSPPIVRPASRSRRVQFLPAASLAAIVRKSSVWKDWFSADSA